MADLRWAIIFLAKSTGWGRAEILDMDESDFWADLETAQQINSEIANAVSR